MTYSWNNFSFVKSAKTGNLFIAAMSTLGYPALSDGGKIMQRVDGPSYLTTVGPAKQLRQGSDLTGGASGGPWVVNFTAVDPVFSGGALPAANQASPWSASPPGDRRSQRAEGQLFVAARPEPALPERRLRRLRRRQYRRTSERRLHADRQRGTNLRTAGFLRLLSRRRNADEQDLGAAEAGGLNHLSRFAKFSQPDQSPIRTSNPATSASRQSLLFCGDDGLGQPCSARPRPPDMGGLTLAHQFSLAAGAVLISGMLVIGLWVTRQIEEGVTRNTATATALYVDSVIAPLLPDIREPASRCRRARAGRSTRPCRRARSAGASPPSRSGRRTASIAYSSRPELIGQRFEPTDNLSEAWAGQVTAEFDELRRRGGRAGARRRRAAARNLQPDPRALVGRGRRRRGVLRDRGRPRATTLPARGSRSWLVVAVVTLCMMGLLSGIVLRGSSADHRAAQGAGSGGSRICPACCARTRSCACACSGLEPRGGAQRALPEADQRRPARRPGAAPGARLAAARRVAVARGVAGAGELRRHPDLSRRGDGARSATSAAG